jgi:hypothetical protein
MWLKERFKVVLVVLHGFRRVLKGAFWSLFYRHAMNDLAFLTDGQLVHLVGIVKEY